MKKTMMFVALCLSLIACSDCPSCMKQECHQQVLLLPMWVGKTMILMPMVVQQCTCLEYAVDAGTK